MAVDTSIPLDPESLKLPAIFVNRFQVTPFGTHFRVSFAETVKPSPTASELVNYRFAAMLTRADAEALAEVLTVMLARTPAVTSSWAPPPPPVPPSAM